MIYFDEAGNSGGNLLDKAQPTYVLLSHDYTVEETKTLLTPLRNLCQADELHFKQLKKYSKFRNGIIGLINHDLINTPRIFFYYAHKEFMIAIQIVDQLIEPVMHGAGINIYETGYNIATANLFNMLGVSVWNKELFKLMCSRFVYWIRNDTLENCDAFYHTVFDLQQVTKPEYQDILDMIMASRAHLKSIRRAITKYSLDATLSCFNAHCNYWAGVYNKPFNVTLDNSKQIEYWKDMIDFMTHNLPTAIVGFGSRKHRYPLLINSMKTLDSAGSLEIQLADILASSINYLAIQAVNNSHDEFSKKIMESKLFLQTSGASMWPGTEVTPESLNMTDPSGIDALDFLADAALKRPKKFNKARKKS